MVSLIYGNEPYLMRQELSKISRDDIDTNLVSSWEEGSELVYVPAIFSDRRTIIVQIERLGADEELLSYLKQPSSLCDVYIFAKEADRNTKVYKAIAKDYTIVDCSKLSEEKMKEFVKSALAEDKASMTQGSYALFMQRANYWDDDMCNLFTIRTYLYQMATAAEDGHITKDVVSGIVPESTSEKAYMLSTYLLEQDHKKAMRSAVHLLKEKEQPIAMLSAIMRTFRLGYKASLFKDHGKEVGKLIGVPYYHYKAAMKYPPDILKACMDTLQEGVNQIKQGFPGDKVFITILGKVSNLLQEVR